MLQSWLDVRVRTKRTDAENISVFELEDVAKGELPGFSAGSHIDVQIAPDLIRQYSLCNDPLDEERYIIAVQREANSRGGSQTLCDKVDVGDILRISEPRNHFELVPTAPRNLLFAGGIGITPLLSMAERLAYIGGDFHLHYSAKSPTRAAFADHIAASSFASRVSFHFSNGPEDQKLDLASALELDGYSHIYVCGPEGYITKVLETARTMGWPNARLHREYFSASAITGDDLEFSIQIASTGEILTVPPSVTVSSVLRNKGIPVNLSCEQGLCGACLTPVLSGELDHRDRFLTNEEHEANDQFTACCSRGKGGLVILGL